LCPHLELSHHRFRAGETYDEQLGRDARERVGRRKWQKRVLKAIDNMRWLGHFDRLYIGGGHANKLTVDQPEDVVLVDNKAGLMGGAGLWRAH
jgi:polyphosphate glucokinase